MHHENMILLTEMKQLNGNLQYIGTFYTGKIEEYIKTQMLRRNVYEIVTIILQSLVDNWCNIVVGYDFSMSLETQTGWGLKSSH